MVGLWWECMAVWLDAPFTLLCHYSLTLTLRSVSWLLVFPVVEIRKSFLHYLTVKIDSCRPYEVHFLRPSSTHFWIPVPCFSASTTNLSGFTRCFVLNYNYWFICLSQANCKLSDDKVLPSLSLHTHQLTLCELNWCHLNDNIMLI